MKKLNQLTNLRVAGWITGPAPAILLFWMLTVGAALGQNPAQYVFPSQGSYDSSADLSLSWTIGDNYIKTDESSAMTLTQGFQQSTLRVEEVRVPSTQPFPARVFPNPTSGHLTLTTEADGTCVVEVFDSAGRLINKTNAAGRVSEIDISQESPGIYFLRLSDNHSSRISLFKITKL